MLFRIHKAYEGCNYGDIIVGSGKSINRLYKRLTGKTIWSDSTGFPTLAGLQKNCFCYHSSPWDLMTELEVTKVLMDYEYGKYIVENLNINETVRYYPEMESDYILHMRIFYELPEKDNSFYSTIYDKLKGIYAYKEFSEIFDRWYQNKKKALKSIPFEDR